MLIARQLYAILTDLLYLSYPAFATLVFTRVAISSKCPIAPVFWALSGIVSYSSVTKGNLACSSLTPCFEFLYTRLPNIRKKPPTPGVLSPESGAF